MSAKFEANLKKICKTCSENSIKVYMRAAKRLYALKHSSGVIPDSTSWLKSKDLKEKYQKIALGKRRHLSLAGHMFAKAFGEVDEYWKTRMFKDSEDYSEERKKNKKSTKETKNWITDALKKLKKVATEYKRTINYKLKQTPSIANLWLYTQYIILRFYSEIQLRNDLGNVSLKDTGKNNYLKRVKGSKYDLIMREFKASKKIGDRIIHVSKALSNVLYTYINYRNRVALKHTYMLSNSKGQKLSKSALGKALRKITLDKLSKNIGVRMLRIFNASENAKLLQKAEEISHNMLHSAKQSREYIRN